MITRQPRGTRSGGRFSPGVRTEPTLALSPGKTSAAVYRRYTQNEMGRATQRGLSRRLIQEAYDSKLLHRMSGSRGLAEAGAVLAAADDDRKLDAAIQAVTLNEQRNPGTVRPDSLGFQLCRHLLQEIRISPKSAGAR